MTFKLHPTLIFTLFFAILLVPAFQHDCSHGHQEHEVLVADPSYSLYDNSQPRMLQYQYTNIKVIFDDSTLIGVSDDFREYITGSLMPPILNYAEATLKVPRRTSNLKAGGYTTLCSNDVTVPTIYNTVGVDSDLVVFLRAKNETSATYVASASACMLETTNKRPVFGRINFNINKISPTNNQARRERDIMTVLHEFTHILGFSGSLFRYYINPATGDYLTGHVTTKRVLGFTQTVLNLPTLTPRLRAHFNCPTIEGAYIENEGGSGSAGSHFERRIFYNEYMTASAIIDTRVTEFSLALLEGTGWYQVNYSMAEPITYGKNKGCGFIDGGCVDRTTKRANFEEFCTPVMSKSCSWTGRAGSSCGSFRSQTATGLNSEIDWFGNGTLSADAFSDNCPTRLPYSDLDCEDPDNGLQATIAGESYDYGSKCFMATLYPRGQLAANYPYCFKSSCVDNGNGVYSVKVTVGSRTVNCNSAGPITVPDYSGTLTCPDPAKFCYQSLNEGFCRRKCSGRGTCVNRECQCEDGWGGPDCSVRVHDTRCSQCQGNPFETSCFGDQCYCHTDNTFCMCGLGLINSTECITATTDTFSGSITTDSSNIYVINNARTNDLEKVDADSKNGFLIPAIAGGVVAVVLIGLGALGYKYRVPILRKIQQLKKSAQREVQVAVVKPVEIAYSTQPEQQSNILPNIDISPSISPRSHSPDMSHRNSITMTHDNSPIMSTQGSPTRVRLHAPSILSRFSQQEMAIRPVEFEPKGFTLRLEPVDLEQNAQDDANVESSEVEKSSVLSLPSSKVKSGELQSSEGSKIVTAQEVKIEPSASFNNL